MKTSLQIVPYAGWSRCLRLSDGRTEAVIPTEIGPRVMRFGFIGGPNLFKEYAAQLGKRGGKKWRIYGGHRLWVAPEKVAWTNIPDNEEIAWSWNGRELRIRQKPDSLIHMAKEIRLSYVREGVLRLEHRVINRGQRAIELAPWTLSVMTVGGEAVFPQEAYHSHRHCKLPSRPLVLWPYTDMSDKRWTWGARELRLRQDTKATGPQKVGFLSKQGWMAYLLKGQAFVKAHTFQEGVPYPDFGCNVETFTNEGMLELESLAPLRLLKPGATATHVEQWGLFRHTGAPTAAALAGFAAKVKYAI